MDGNGGGLVVAPRDQSLGTSWEKAQTICGDLDIGGYYDWYLPSKEELNLLYYNHGDIEGMGSGRAHALGIYWSSTEYGESVAWTQNFINGLQNFDGKASLNYVRAIRAF